MDNILERQARILFEKGFCSTQVREQGPVFGCWNADCIECIKDCITKGLVNNFEIVKFFDKTGLKRFFLELSTNNIQDYILGVEVGMDTHARKNRSGNSMELLIEPIIKNIATRKRCKFTNWCQRVVNLIRRG